MLSFTSLLIYNRVKPESFAKIEYIPSEQAVVWVDVTGSNSERQAAGNGILINEIQPASLYFIYFQLMIVLILAWLIIREFKNVIRSVQQLQSFKSQNVESFRKMAIYFLGIFFLTSFSFYVMEDKGSFTFDLDLKFAMLAIASYILAEIFKEGNRLQEEQQFTV